MAEQDDIMAAVDAALNPVIDRLRGNVGFVTHGEVITAISAVRQAIANVVAPPVASTPTAEPTPGVEAPAAAPEPAPAEAPASDSPSGLYTDPQ